MMMNSSASSSATIGGPVMRKVAERDNDGPDLNQSRHQQHERHAINLVLALVDGCDYERRRQGDVVGQGHGVSPHREA